MGGEDAWKCSPKNAALKTRQNVLFFSDGLAVATVRAKLWLHSVLITPHDIPAPPPPAIRKTVVVWKCRQRDGLPERLPPQGRQRACSECPPAGRGTRERCGTKERKHNRWWAWPFYLSVWGGEALDWGGEATTSMIQIDADAPVCLSVRLVSRRQIMATAEDAACWTVDLSR